MERRRVLIISHDFPELSDAGVIRTYQFAKKLPEFGWRPLILTAQECGNRRWDVSGDIEFSDGELPCPKITAKTLRFLPPFRRHRPARASQYEMSLKRNRFRNRLRRFASQFALPDGKLGWLYPAVKRGVQIAGTYSYHACFSVSPRPTAHLVAYRLARRLNIPWVADFALPWSDAYWLAGRPLIVDRLDQKLEHLIVRSAQHITVAYPELARSLSTRHGGAFEDKISVIPTGFQEQLFAGQPQVAGKFTIIYPGNHFCEPGRHGEYFLRAIDDWIASDPSLARKVEFVFIGKRDDDLLRHRAAMTHPKVVRVESLVSHRACIQAIRSSHACVVNTIGNRIPGKLYECMRAGKPILGLADQGSDLESAIQGYANGIVVAAKNRQSIVRALGRMRAAEFPATAEMTEHGGPLSHYDTARSVKSLALIFDRAICSNRRP